MLILFDHSVPAPLRDHLKNHAVAEAIERGWDRLSNGDLLAAAEAAGFDVLLTADNNLSYQQNLKERKIAIIVLTGNRWRMVQRMVRKIVAAVDGAKPGSLAVIEIPVQ
jgi:predicted nuclease of predicted toxin-antitoxin system